MQDLFSLFVAIDSRLYRMFGCMVLSRQNLYDDSSQSQRIPAAIKDFAKDICFVSEYANHIVNYLVAGSIGHFTPSQVIQFSGAAASM